MKNTREIVGKRDPFRERLYGGKGGHAASKETGHIDRRNPQMAARWRGWDLRPSKELFANGGTALRV